MKSGLLRTLAIVGAFAGGALLPQAAALAWLIRWLIMVMLFVTFLEVRLSHRSLVASHAWLFIANLLMGFVGYGLGWLLGGRNVALAGFFAAITPTATAAPVIMRFLRGQVEYVIAAFMLTNIGISLLLPELLPPLLGVNTAGLYLQVLKSVVLIVFAPLIAAMILRRWYPAAGQWTKRLRNVTFGFWVIVLFLITANAMDFLQQSARVDYLILGKLGLVSIIVCALNFFLGGLIGGKTFRREASQALGQKNTTFTIYLAMAYASPLVAIGPTFYVLWHNLWNSWQLFREEQRPAEARIPTEHH